MFGDSVRARARRRTTIARSPRNLLARGPLRRRDPRGRDGARDLRAYPGGFNEVHLRWAGAVLADVATRRGRRLATLNSRSMRPPASSTCRRCARRIALPRGAPRRTRRVEEAYAHQLPSCSTANQPARQPRERRVLAARALEHELRTRARPRSGPNRHASRDRGAEPAARSAQLAICKRKVREVERLQARLADGGGPRSANAAIQPALPDSVVPGLISDAGAAGRRWRWR